MGEVACEDTMHPSLMELPDELLSKVLVGAGGRTIGSSVVCKRLQTAKEALGQHTVFASAASQLPQLEDALRDAATRAMEGMLGSVSFAVLFTCNYPHPKKYRDPSDVSNAAEILASHLPKGTPVVGCTVAGLMGIGADGKPFEIDPTERNRRGVTVLLGHMPHAVVRLFADTQPPTPSGRAPRKVSDSWAPIEQWVGLKRDGLVPVSAWLMLQATRSASSCMTGPGGVIDWIQRQVPPGAAPVPVAGGVASGRAPDLLFLPGRQEEEAGLAPGWDPMEGVRKARYVGVMVCARPGLPPAAPPAPFSQVSNCAPASSSHATTTPMDLGSPPGGSYPTLPHPHGDLRAGGGPSGCGIAGAAPVGSASVGRSVGEGGPCAALLSMRGVGPHAGSSWWGGLPLELVHLEEEECYLVNMADVSSLRRIGHHSQPGTTTTTTTTGDGEGVTAATPASTSQAPSSRPRRSSRRSSQGGGDGEQAGRASGSEAAQGAAEAGQGSGGAEAARKLPPSFWAEYASLQGARVDEQDDLMLALFRSDATPDCGKTGITPEVMDSGLCIVLGLGHCPFSGAFRVVVDDADSTAIKDIMALGPEHVCCQLASTGPGPVRELLARELGIARQLCCPAPVPGAGSGPAADPRSWEGYAQLREAARAAGARSGPVGMAVFTCTGRGQTIFGADGDSEAAIADEVLNGEVPFVGAFCNGEIGPYIRNGYVGWAVSGAAQSSYSAPSAGTQPAAVAGVGAAGMVGDGEGAGDEEGSGAAMGATATQAYVTLRGKAVEQCACMPQGWTSMYGLLS